MSENTQGIEETTNDTLGYKNASSMLEEISSEALKEAIVVNSWDFLNVLRKSNVEEPFVDRFSDMAIEFGWFNGVKCFVSTSHVRLFNRHNASKEFVLSNTCHDNEDIYAAAANELKTFADNKQNILNLF